MEGFKRVLTTYYNNKGVKMKTKQQLADEIKALQTQLDAMPEVLGINYKPKYNEEYFAINSNGSVSSLTWFDDISDKARYARGNCYPTREAAERIDRNRMTLVKLREFAFVPDFKDKRQERHSFYMDGKDLVLRDYFNYNHGEPACFTNQELRHAAREAVGEAAIIDMLEGGLV